MPRVRYTAEGGRYRAGGVTFEPGDTHEVSSALAEHLVEDVGDFEHATADNSDAAADETADPSGDEADDNDTITTADLDATDDTSENDDQDESDSDADSDSNEVGEFVIDEWLDMDYSERAERVEAGEVDDHLDEIADAETSENVTDAIGVRRAELAEE